MLFELDERVPTGEVNMPSGDMSPGGNVGHVDHTWTGANLSSGHPPILVAGSARSPATAGRWASYYPVPPRVRTRLGVQIGGGEEQHAECQDVDPVDNGGSG